MLVSPPVRFWFLGLEVALHFLSLLSSRENMSIIFIVRRMVGVSLVWLNRSGVNISEVGVYIIFLHDVLLSALVLMY